MMQWCRLPAKPAGSRTISAGIRSRSGVRSRTCTGSHRSIAISHPTRRSALRIRPPERSPTAARTRAVPLRPRRTESAPGRHFGILPRHVEAQIRTAPAGRSCRPRSPRSRPAAPGAGQVSARRSWSASCGSCLASATTSASAVRRLWLGLAAGRSAPGDAATGGRGVSASRCEHAGIGVRPADWAWLGRPVALRSEARRPRLRPAGLWRRQNAFT